MSVERVENVEADAGFGVAFTASKTLLVTLFGAGDFAPSNTAENWAFKFRPNFFFFLPVPKRPEEMDWLTVVPVGDKTELCNGVRALVLLLLRLLKSPRSATSLERSSTWSSQWLLVMVLSLFMVEISKVYPWSNSYIVEKK